MSLFRLGTLTFKSLFDADWDLPSRPPQPDRPFAALPVHEPIEDFPHEGEDDPIEDFSPSHVASASERPLMSQGTESRLRLVQVESRAWSPGSLWRVQGLGHRCATTGGAEGRLAGRSRPWPP